MKKNITFCNFTVTRNKEISSNGLQTKI